MTPSRHTPRHPADDVEAAAADWVLRLDRGLSAAEQDALSAWLAGDPSRREAFAEATRAWDHLGRLAGVQSAVAPRPDPDLLAPPRRHRPRHLRRLARWSLATAAAGALAGLALTLTRSGSSEGRQPVEAAQTFVSALALIERRILPDGSTAELNRGTQLEEAYSGSERRIRLLQGEAYFNVQKDASRPFIVEAGGLIVQAVGTEFNVRLAAATVEVLVTEGVVRLGESGSEPLDRAGSSPPLLGAGQRATVTLVAAAAPRVAVVSRDETEAALAWTPRLLDFTDRPMAEIVTEFNRRNPVQLELGDPALGQLRLSATFRSDNVEGFVRLMQSDFGIHALWKDSRTIVLRRER
jgi:transmembrane sensor